MAHVKFYALLNFIVNTFTQKRFIYCTSRALGFPDAFPISGTGNTNKILSVHAIFFFDLRGSLVVKKRLIYAPAAVPIPSEPPIWPPGIFSSLYE